MSGLLKEISAIAEDDDERIKVGQHVENISPMRAGKAYASYGSPAKVGDEGKVTKVHDLRDVMIVQFKKSDGSVVYSHVQNLRAGKAKAVAEAKGGKENYEELEHKMDKFMPDDPDLQDEYYDMLDKHDEEGLVAFFHEWSDSDAVRRYAGKGATVEGFVKYLLDKN